MRKSRVAPCLVVAGLLLLSSVSMAGVVFTLTSPSDGLVTLGYTATPNTGIRGIALNVRLSDNATAVYSDTVSIHPVFNTFIDYSITNPTGFDVGVGHPFAYPGQAGALEDPASFFTLCMGALDLTGGQALAPAVVENMITFRILDGGAGFSFVTLSEDALRGGVIGDNIGTVTMPQPLRVVIPEPCTLLLLGLGGLMVRQKVKGER